jgi:hypothetical protein
MAVDRLNPPWHFDSTSASSVSPKKPSPFSQVSPFAPMSMYSPSVVTSSNTGAGSSRYATSSNSSSTDRAKHIYSIARICCWFVAIQRKSGFKFIDTQWIYEHTSESSDFLALFNQIASQKRINPQWKTSQSGPDHRPVFYTKKFGRPFNFRFCPQLAARDAGSNVTGSKVP